MYGQSMTEELPVHEIIVKKNAECIKVHDLNFISVNHTECFLLEKNYVTSDETLVKIHHPEVLLQPPNIFG